VTPFYFLSAIYNIFMITNDYENVITAGEEFVDST